MFLLNNKNKHIEAVEDARKYRGIYSHLGKFVPLFLG